MSEIEMDAFFNDERQHMKEGVILADGSTAGEERNPRVLVHVAVALLVREPLKKKQRDFISSIFFSMKENHSGLGGLEK